MSARHEKPTERRRALLAARTRLKAPARVTSRKHRGDRRTVEGPHGKILDSSALFTLDKGQNYKDFWSNVSTAWFDAAFAVVGTPFDADPTPDSVRLSGEPEVDIIVDKLRIGKNSKVLEIGCGVARLAWHMVKRCGHYTGSDITKNMLEVSRRELAGARNFDLVELFEAKPLPFPDASFDAVYSQAVFIHIDREDCFRYMQEAFRVLKPGGRAYFQFYNLNHPVGGDIFEWVAKNTVTPEGKVRGRVHFLGNEEVRTYAKRAGFVVDEAASHLETVEQNYSFPVPMTNYDYYLIAVGAKPSGPGPRATLTSEAEHRPLVRFSDAYYARYLDGFYKKIARHMPMFDAELTGFLKTRSSPESFRIVIEVERGVIELQRRKADPTGLLPVLRDAVNRSNDEPLERRVRAGIQGFLAKG